jgi:acyl-coenzyme A thioesterase PaaI-like protein
VPVGFRYVACVTDDPRLDAAAALRRLNDAFVAHDADDTLLTRIADGARAATTELHAGERRDRAALLAAHFGRRTAADPVDEALRSTDNPMTDRAVCGTTNPLAAECTFSYEGDEVVVRTVLGAAYEGAPRRSHGGMVAALFDDIAAGVLPLAGVAAYTGELTVRYLRPVPIEEPLEFRARIDGHEGRKLRASADCIADGVVVATAHVLYITVDTAEFGQPTG